MTKLERAAEKARKEKEKLQEIERLAKETRAAQREAIQYAEAAVREETRKATNKRRYQVGAMAEEAGLFAWSAADFGAVFQLLARLKDCPHPAAVLEGLLEAEDGYREITLSRFDLSGVFPKGHGEESPPPRLETFEESDRREATRK